MSRHKAGAHKRIRKARARVTTALVIAPIAVWVTQGEPAYAPGVMTFNPAAQHPYSHEYVGQPDFIPHEFNPQARLDVMQVTLP